MIPKPFRYVPRVAEGREQDSWFSALISQGSWEHPDEPQNNEFSTLECAYANSTLLFWALIRLTSQAHVCWFVSLYRFEVNDALARNFMIPHFVCPQLDVQP